LEIEVKQADAEEVVHELKKNEIRNINLNTTYKINVIIQFMNKM